MGIEEESKLEYVNFQVVRGEFPPESASDSLRRNFMIDVWNRTQFQNSK